MTSGLALDHFLPYLTAVLASRISVSLAAVYDERFGISIPEWRIIAHLAGSQGVSVRDIYERVEMDKPKVSRAAARLGQAGLVRKRVDPRDRRLVSLSLTRKGQRLFQEIEPLALRFERELLAALDPAERLSLVHIMRKLLATFETSQPEGDRKSL